MIALSELIKIDERKKKIRYSYGILAYVLNPFRILLAHPGGPEFLHKNKNCWSIPKGASHKIEDGWEAAQREFKEETGLDLPPNTREIDAINLGTITQKSGKIVRAWAIQMEDDDISNFKSNTFLFKWPGHEPIEYPEIDKVKYFTPKEAIRRLNPYQLPFIKRLIEDLKISLKSL